MIGYNILPIGFSSYEKSTIETFFRLAGRRSPHWGLTGQSREARVILFNAVSQKEVDTFRGMVASWQKVIVVGASDFGTGWPVLPRPIKLTSILGLLDVIAKESEPQSLAEPTVAQVAPEHTATATQSYAIDYPLTNLPNMTDVFANITTQAPTPVATVTRIEPLVTPVATPVSLDEAPSFNAATDSQENVSNKSLASDRPMLGQVLIVDDSDIALKHMQNRLRHFGYESELARSGDEALAMVSNQSYHFVFLDVMMQGLDGYQTCRAIKNNKARRGPPPIVVMLTSKGGTIDKIRGTMAGCDAYMTKPLNERQLTTVLTKFDPSTMLQRYQALKHPVSMASKPNAAAR